MTSAFLTNKEYSELLEDIKFLLKESYHISADETSLIINKSSEIAEGLFDDYFHMLTVSKKLVAESETFWINI